MSLLNSNQINLFDEKKKDYYSIKFNSDKEYIKKYILKYSLFQNPSIKNFISDGFSRTRNFEDYELDLKLDYGYYELITEKDSDNQIYIHYRQEHITVGCESYPKKYEELILYSINKEVLVDFIEKARKYNNELDKNDKLTIRVLNDTHWMILSKLHKRPIETLFLDFNIEELVQEITNFFNTENEYIENGVPFKMNFLFHGIHGAGKSSLIYSLASHFNMDIATLNITKDLDDNTFIKAITKIPDNTILVLEDVDALFIERESKTNISFSALLNILDGILRKHKLLTFLTTNHKDRLDEALIRPGRIDKEIKFTYCTNKQAEKMYDYFFKNNINYEVNKKKFINFIKKFKYTSSDLHKFMFKNRKIQNPMDNIEEFTELLNKKTASYDMLYL
jgi:chaperone BCS1